MGAFIFALLSGAAITAQAGSNSQLKQSLRDPIIALTINYIFGLVSVMLVVLFARVPLPTMQKIAAAPWWAWMGGLLGVLYGLSVVFLASRMGAATLISTVVTGQLVFALVVDHFGWIGFEVHRAGALRILGCVLMIGGFALISKF
jgi:bacterial/archaeal transporter family-2 protein